MPKRWIVTLSGEVFDRINGPDANQFSHLTTEPATRVVDADALEVSGGALVFEIDGQKALVFGPGSYWLVEEVDDDSTGPGDDGAAAD